MFRFLPKRHGFWSRQQKKKVICLCCGYRTLDERGAFDICPICFWEDVLDIKSSANHLLTLRQGRENYKKIGACCKEELQYCRKPKKSEMV